jgi:ABC-2 type transport system permease protein
MSSLIGLSMRQLSSRRRMALILLLAVLPVLLTWIIVTFNQDDNRSGFVEIMLDGMIITAIVPIVTIALATTAFGNELEDRTLGYLMMKPVSRWKIAFPKIVAAIAVAGPAILISAVLTTLIGLTSDVRTIAAVVLALAAGVLAYSSIFMWAGLMTTRALGFALVYVFLWEGLLTSFLSGIRFLSVRGYMIGILHGVDPEGFAELQNRAIQFPAAIAGTIIVTVVFFFLTVRRLRNMDVP